MTKLSDQEVKHIYELRDVPEVYATDLAKKYGVSLSLISRIWTGKRRSKATKEGK